MCLAFNDFRCLASPSIQSHSGTLAKYNRPQATQSFRHTQRSHNRMLVHLATLAFKQCKQIVHDLQQLSLLFHNRSLLSACFTIFTSPLSNKCPTLELQREPHSSLLEETVFIPPHRRSLLHGTYTFHKMFVKFVLTLKCSFHC